MTTIEFDSNDWWKESVHPSRWVLFYFILLEIYVVVQTICFQIFRFSVLCFLDFLECFRNLTQSPIENGPTTILILMFTSRVVKNSIKSKINLTYLYIITFTYIQSLIFTFSLPVTYPNICHFHTYILYAIYAFAHIHGRTRMNIG